MEFGLSISGMAIAPMSEHGGMGRRLEDIMTWVREARELEFDYITTGQHFTIDFDQLSQGRFIVGSPDNCVAQLQRFKALGVGVINFRMSWPEC